MFNISNSYIGAQCDLLTMDNKILTNGRLKKVGFDFVEISNDIKTLSLLRYEETVKVEIKHASLPTIVVAGRLYLPNMDFFRIVDIDALANSESREFFRVNVGDKALIKKRNTNGVESMNFEVTLVDISLGGALIASGLAFENGNKVALGIEIDGERIFYAAEIVRTLPKEKNLFRYGLKFVEIKGSVGDKLCKYLFIKQKEIINELKK